MFILLKDKFKPQTRRLVGTRWKRCNHILKLLKDFLSPRQWVIAVLVPKFKQVTQYCLQYAKVIKITPSFSPPLPLQLEILLHSIAFLK